MAEYSFERECRTPYSEIYSVNGPQERVGRVDLHYTPTVVHATLQVVESLTLEAIHDLIEAIDEELVMSADVPREDFVISVYQGREVGVFSDETLETNGNGGNSAPW